MGLFRKIIGAVLSLMLLVSQLYVLGGALDQRERAERLSRDIARLEPEVGQSKDFIALMQTRDTPAIRGQVNADYIDANFDLIMERVYLYLPQEAPRNIQPVGYMVREMSGKRFVFVALEYEFSDRWIIATITVEPTSGKQAVAGFNINTYTSSLFERTQFRLDGQSVEHYALLGLAVINLIFCAVTLFICIAAPRVRWRFVWIAVILLGVGLMSFNWLEGRMALNLLSANLPPSRFSLALYQPLIILLSIPLGAILFWMNFRKLTRA
ncbi:hypothetical protein [Asticcacaulis sp. AND118]|uniref:hypothetical protein n=1 Tax=Asticcacaulis sp. AND118 TaxID=2840468 RepID=UPI001CFF6637|nr:hypothetical protein [Asticcacaulis sp. AND118]UDF04145.1 hypothetical protein LH365_03630 [Asticcacaulis sp. AND118]